MGEKNVLVLLWHSQNERCVKSLPGSVSKKYNFFYQQTGKYDPRTSKFTLLDYVEDAKDLIKKHNISILLSINVDLANMVTAVLAREMPELKLRAPSVESIFLCHHKYYARCFMDPDPMPFALFDLFTEDFAGACDEVVQKVPFPAFLKPCSGTRSEGIANVPTKEQLAPKLKEFMRKYIESDVSSVRPILTKVLNPFYSKYVDIERYPLSLVPSVLIEEHMGTAPSIRADGYVFNGEIFHWALADNIYHTAKPQCFIAIAHPSLTPAAIQEKVWKLYDEVLHKMIACGFDKQFVNIEMFILENKLRIMEINPRNGLNVALYSGQVFDQTITEALLKIGQGIPPGTPVANGRHAFFGYVNTTGSGKAKEFLDFNADPTIDPLVTPDDIIDGSGDSGCILARMSVAGESREDVMKKYKAICRKVLLKPELSLWD